MPHQRVVATCILLQQVVLVLAISLEDFYKENLIRNIAELVPNDDDASIAIDLSPSFPFYGQHYDKCYVSS